MIGGLIKGFGSLLGSSINASKQEEINKKNADLQKEFAQNSIQWKVADAKKAGIHPLAALGASGYSASPSYVGANMGDGIAGFAKNLGGAIQADARQQMKDNSEMRALEIEHQKLLNEALRKKIRGDNDTITPLLGGSSNAPTPSNINHVLNKDNVSSRPSGKASKEMVDYLKKADQPFTLLKRPNGDYDFSLDPNSLSGQSFADGLTGKALGYIDIYEFLTSSNYYNLRQLEKIARSNGVLTKDKPYFDVSLTAKGVKLTPSSRDFAPPKKQDAPPPPPAKKTKSRYHINTLNRRRGKFW